MLAKLLPDQLNHLLVEWTGIAHRRTLLDARGKGDNLCATVNEQLGFEQHPLAGTTAAVRKANEFQVALHVGKRAALASDSHKVSSSRTIVLGLHTADNAYFCHNLFAKNL